jgi:hypothetical protein
MSSKPLNAAFTYILLYFLPFEYNIYIMCSSELTLCLMIDLISIIVLGSH